MLERNLAKPSEIGAAAVDLASDGAEFVTGHILCVDGGTLIASRPTSRTDAAVSAGVAAGRTSGCRRDR